MGEVERKIDKLGRVVIPIEFRRKIGAQKDASVLVSMDNDSVIITSASKKCALCGAWIVEEGRFRLCKECVRRVREEL